MTDYPPAPSASLPTWINPIYRARIEQRRRDALNARERARLARRNRH